MVGIVSQMSVRQKTGGCTGAYEIGSKGANIAFTPCRPYGCLYTPGCGLVAVCGLPAHRLEPPARLHFLPLDFILAALESAGTVRVVQLCQPRLVKFDPRPWLVRDDGRAILRRNPPAYDDFLRLPGVLGGPGVSQIRHSRRQRGHGFQR